LPALVQPAIVLDVIYGRAASRNRGERGPLVRIQGCGGGRGTRVGTGLAGGNLQYLGTYQSQPAAAQASAFLGLPQMTSGRAALMPCTVRHMAHGLAIFERILRAWLDGGVRVVGLYI